MITITISFKQAKQIIDWLSNRPLISDDNRVLRDRLKHLAG